MGIYDSSMTRVAPIFDILMDSDPTGASWLHRLIRLGSRAGEVILPIPLGRLRHDHGRLWGSGERALPAPRSLLEWLVRNISEEAVESTRDTGETLEKRRALARRDSDVISDALTRLRNNERGRNWWVLEGESRPDAMVVTDRLVLVVEGKRTERFPTSQTKWMAKRSQLIRHMDAALETADGRLVLGMLLVEGEPPDPTVVPERWALASADHLRHDLLAASLPHRSGEERQRIANGFLGFATWQLVCNEFGIDWPPKPSTH